MKILTVKEKLKVQKIFSLQDIYTVFPNFRQETLCDWEKQGDVRKIRDNYYTFSDIGFQDMDYFIESALNYYGIIPERNYSFTKVMDNHSTEKSQRERFLR